jgi:hypothetical protein
MTEQHRGGVKGGFKVLMCCAVLCCVLQLPDTGDAEGRRALKRLQDVGVHVLAPAAELAAKPLPGAVAVMTLGEALAAGREGCVYVGVC